MKKNKGFVSLTIIYAFMILFLLILLSIVSFYVSNRIILKKSRDTAKNIMVDKLEKKSNKGYQVKIEYEQCDNPTISEGYHQWCNSNQLSCRVAKKFNPNNISASDVMLHNAIILNEDSCAVLDANDNSYRFVSKKDMSNYVCFGYDLGLVNDNTECPPNNLYRIIGIFKNQFGTYETKIIKADYATKEELGTTYYNAQYSTNYKGNQYPIAGYRWTSSLWKDSTFNKTNLNNTFYKSLQPNDIPYWTNLIVNHEWYVIDISNISVTAKDIQEEFLPKNSTLSTNIGLMDIIDYAYANPIDMWDKNVNTNNKNNWLYFGADEMMMTQNGRNIYYLEKSGNIQKNNSNNYLAARPVFYLRNSVRVTTTGDGSKDNPYRLGV